MVHVSCPTQTFWVRGVSRLPNRMGSVFEVLTLGERELPLRWFDCSGEDVTGTGGGAVLVTVCPCTPDTVCWPCTTVNRPALGRAGAWVAWGGMEVGVGCGAGPLWEWVTVCCGMALLSGGMLWAPCAVVGLPGSRPALARSELCPVLILVFLQKWCCRNQKYEKKRANEKI